MILGAEMRALRPVPTDEPRLNAPRAQTAGLTLAVLSAPVAIIALLKPVYLDRSEASAGIETAITALAFACVALLVRRFRVSHQLRDLLLLAAVAAACVIDFAFAAAPALAGVHRAVAGTSARLALQTLVAAAFVAAALAPRKTVAERVRRMVALAGVAAVTTFTVAELLDLITGAGPLVGTVDAAMTEAHAPDPFVLAAVIASSGILVVAGIAFAGGARRRVRTDAWLLAGATFLIAAAGVESISMPAAAASWVTPAAVLRLIAFTMILTATLLASARTRRDEALAAVIAERQRIARDLHDGLAQDLATIKLRAQRLNGSDPDHVLMLAAQRALAASRGTIVDLSASGAPTRRQHCVRWRMNSRPASP